MTLRVEGRTIFREQSTEIGLFLSNTLVEEKPNPANQFTRIPSASGMALIRHGERLKCSRIYSIFRKQQQQQQSAQLLPDALADSRAKVLKFTSPPITTARRGFSDVARCYCRDNKTGDSTLCVTYHGDWKGSRA